MRYIFISFVVFFSCNAFSSSLVLNLGSIHSGQNEKIDGRTINFNQFNLGLGHESRIFGQATEFGFYRNSDYKNSFYVLVNKTLRDHFGYSIGGATGYEIPVTPVLTLNVFTDHLFTRFTVCPAYGSDIRHGIQALATFSLKFGLKEIEI